MPYWSNDSVLAFAAGRDPIQAIENEAKRVVLEAVEQGWTGPPFDPFELARIRGLEVVPRQELRDARTVPVGDDKVLIEYNPTKPAPRLRFSLAHEIAHTLFPDVAEAARYRDDPGAGPADGWQLELLCNIAASEILMPTETLEDFRNAPITLEKLLELRRTFGVSTEALLRRATKVTTRPLAMFASSRIDSSKANSPFRVDYTVGSRAWNPKVPAGEKLPGTSVLAECTAIGFTAKGHESWGRLRDLEIQAVGVPPFPGQRFPRVLGLLRSHGIRGARRNELEVVHGDATDPRGRGSRLIVHLVNDRTANWGGQFARALADRHPESQEDFKEWASDPTNLRLGAVRFCDLGERLATATIVGQKGYGPSTNPRIRYGALAQGLELVAERAIEIGASVHMPRIGAGQARGRWVVTRELIDETLVRQGTRVVVYVPPREPLDDDEAQLTLTVA